MRVTGVLFLLGFLAIGVQAQRPRAVDPGSTKTDAPKTAPAPETMKAKYEGGVFGHNNAMDGTLSFDDTNHVEVEIAAVQRGRFRIQCQRPFQRELPFE